jgi:hypothetical protein
MTMTYRGVAHCDLITGGGCHGLLQIEADSLSLPTVLHQALRGRGWSQAWPAGAPTALALDVCPACRPAARRAGMTLAPPEGWGGGGGGANADPEEPAT